MYRNAHLCRVTLVPHHHPLGTATSVHISITATFLIEFLFILCKSGMPKHTVLQCESLVEFQIIFRLSLVTQKEQEKEEGTEMPRRHQVMAADRVKLTRPRFWKVTTRRVKKLLRRRVFTSQKYLGFVSGEDPAYTGHQCSWQFHFHSEMRHDQ